MHTPEGVRACDKVNVIEVIDIIKECCKRENHGIRDFSKPLILPIISSCIFFPTDRESFFANAFYSNERFEEKFANLEHEVEAIKAKLGWFWLHSKCDFQSIISMDRGCDFENIISTTCIVRHYSCFGSIKV